MGINVIDFYLLDRPVNPEVIQQAMIAFFIVFFIIFYLGQAKSTSINHYFRTSDKGVLFLINCICLSAYAICLVDSVAAVRTIYGEDDQIRLFLYYFIFYAYGFYWGDLLVFLVYSRDYADCFNSDDLFWAGLPYVLAFPLLAFGFDSFDRVTLVTIIIAKFLFSLLMCELFTESAPKPAKHQFALRGGKHQKMD